MTVKAKEKFAERAKRHYKLMLQLFPEEIEYSIENSIIYKDSHKFDNNIHVNINKNIEVIESDSVSAIYSYKKDKTAVLNFASFKNPGGAYLTGSTTQEEMLCAESTLFPVLLEFKKSFYEPHRNKETSNRCLYNSDAIYSPEIVFTRNGDFIKADVITIAAPNLRLREEFNLTQDEINIALEDRIKTIFGIAQDNKIKTLILGAFGCGAFKNSPYKVASIFEENIEKYNIPNIIFAIPKGINFNVFKEIIYQY